MVKPLLPPKKLKKQDHSSNFNNPGEKELDVVPFGASQMLKMKFIQTHFIF